MKAHASCDHETDERALYGVHVCVVVAYTIDGNPSSASTKECKKKIILKKSKNKIKMKSPALPGNRTRVARMGILHDATTPAVLRCIGRFNCTVPTVASLQRGYSLLLRLFGAARV